jgi:hypothetical protein
MFSLDTIHWKPNHVICIMVSTKCTFLQPNIAHFTSNIFTPTSTYHVRCFLSMCTVLYMERALKEVKESWKLDMFLVKLKDNCIVFLFRCQTTPPKEKKVKKDCFSELISSCVLTTVICNSCDGLDKYKCMSSWPNTQGSIQVYRDTKRSWVRLGNATGQSEASTYCTVYPKWPYYWGGGGQELPL